MKKILFVMLLFFGGVYFALTQNFGDVQINKYDSIEAVHSDTAIQRGWIPKVLPLSAHEIVETHDIDTNTNFGTFKYGEKDEENFLSQLSKSNDVYSSEKFLFKINKEKNEVQFRNKLN